MAQNVVLTSLQDLSPIMEECIADGSEVILTITGNSMRPLLRHRRDQVVLKKADKAMLQVGDVPLYRRENGQFVLHRIVGISVSSYTMCGDRQKEKENGIPAKSIVAVATGFYRRGKYLSCDNFWYKLYVKVWMIILPWRPFVLKTGSLVKRCIRKICGIFKKKA